MPANAVRPMERKTGIALWRQVADRIRQGIGSGEFDGDGRLPPETASIGCQAIHDQYPLKSQIPPVKRF